MALKHIKYLSDEEKATLEEMRRHHPAYRVRNRAHALLLSAKGYGIIQLGDIFEVRRNTISAWLCGWETQGIAGILDERRAGRPCIFLQDEQSRFKDYLAENPHQMKEAATRLQEETGKQASLFTYKRVLKKLAMSGSAVGTR